MSPFRRSKPTKNKDFQCNIMSLGERFQQLCHCSIIKDHFRSFKVLKREWGVESNGKLPHLSIPSKTAAWFPEFVVGDLMVGSPGELSEELVT